MAIKPYLQLVRLPNLFTAAADPLAGWLVATGSLDDPDRWFPLVAASVLIYAGGIVLNDVFDVEIDRVERPNRPVPSGQVSYRLAAWFGGLALVAGPFVAALSGSWVSFAVAALLAVTVLAYDAGMKRTLLGPTFMGACRSGNLLLGFSQVERLGGEFPWLIAAAFGLFVMGVTWISRSEVETGRVRGIILGYLLQALAIFAIAGGAAFLNKFLNQATQTPLLGLVLLLVLFQVVSRASFRAIRQPIPATVQRAVKTGVLSLVWLDVAIVAITRNTQDSLVVAALWVPAFVLARWLYAT